MALCYRATVFCYQAPLVCYPQILICYRDPFSILDTRSLFKERFVFVPGKQKKASGLRAPLFQPSAKVSVFCPDNE